MELPITLHDPDPGSDDSDGKSFSVYWWAGAAQQVLSGLRV